LKSFPRERRLLAKAEFQAVFDESNKVSQRYLLALYRPNQQAEARVGIMVGKRAVNLAVERNLIKRVIRESFRINQTKLHGLDIIVIVRHQCNLLTKVQLREGVEKLWQNVSTQLQKQHC
jgi:ribonuclease P protein component